MLSRWIIRFPMPIFHIATHNDIFIDKFNKNRLYQGIRVNFIHFPQKFLPFHINIGNFHLKSDYIWMKISFITSSKNKTKVKNERKYIWWRVKNIGHASNRYFSTCYRSLLRKPAPSFVMPLSSVTPRHDIRSTFVHSQVLLISMVQSGWLYYMCNFFFLLSGKENWFPSKTTNHRTDTDTEHWTCKMPHKWMKSLERKNIRRHKFFHHMDTIR